MLKSLFSRLMGRESLDRLRSVGEDRKVLNALDVECGGA